MLKFGFASPISTALFIVLATFPTVFNDLIRRSGVFTPQADFMAWQNAEHQSRTFHQIGTSFAFKQEVLLFGLRDWVIQSWESAKIASDRHDHARGNMLFKNVTISSLPQNIVKDLLYVRYSSLPSSIPSPLTPHYLCACNPQYKSRGDYLSYVLAFASFPKKSRWAQFMSFNRPQAPYIGRLAASWHKSIRSSTQSIVSPDSLARKPGSRNNVKVAYALERMSQRSLVPAKNVE
jgi:hypothetical protein